MRLGLLKTVTLGRLKTAESAYWKPRDLATRRKSAPSQPPTNVANNESFGLFLTRYRFVDGLRDKGRPTAASLAGGRS